MGQIYAEETPDQLTEDTVLRWEVNGLAHVLTVCVTEANTAEHQEMIDGKTEAQRWRGLQAAEERCIDLGARRRASK